VSYTLCVGEHCDHSAAADEGCGEYIRIRCDGGAAQQGHAVSGSDAIAAPISWWVDLAVRGRAWLVQAINTCRLKTTRIGEPLRIAEAQGGQRCRQPPCVVGDSPIL